jgi:hypothetical protein
MKCQKCEQEAIAQVRINNETIHLCRQHLLEWSIKKPK